MMVSIIVLSAGKGSRMGSELPKVLHTLGDKPMIHHVLDTAMKLNPVNTQLIVGHQADLVKDHTANYSVSYIMQHEQLGTGHAVCQAAPHYSIDNEQDIIILSGDCPLIKEDTLQKLLSYHQTNHLLGTVLSTTLDDAASYGRILRNDTQDFYAIREAKDCTEEELSINEINTGIYCFNSSALFHYLKRLDTNNAQGEYYLTDVLEKIHMHSPNKIGAYVTTNANETLGVNTPEELTYLESLIQT